MRKLGDIDVKKISQGLTSLVTKPWYESKFSVQGITLYQIITFYFYSRYLSSHSNKININTTNIKYERSSIQIQIGWWMIFKSILLIPTITILSKATSTRNFLAALLLFEPVDIYNQNDCKIINYILIWP